MSLTMDVDVQLFEITIRALGGLLSIYHLTNDKGFLSVAVSTVFLVVHRMYYFQIVISGAYVYQVAVHVA